MALQYSSATLVSLHFHSLKEKFGKNLKDVTISLFLLFKNCVSLNLHYLKLCKLQSVFIAVSDGTAENHTEPERTASLWTDI